MANFSLGPVTAICSNFAANWTFDDLGKDPCQVASFLAQACVPDLPEIPPLIRGNAYSGPGSPAESNKCVCSSVTYSMVSACAYCQNGLYRDWAGENSWSQNCTPQDLAVGSFPLIITQNFSVPVWAFLNISATNTWDLNAAHQLAGTVPDVTGHATPVFSTSAPPTPTGLTVPGPELPSFTPTSTTPPKGKSNVAPIVGGIIGAFVVLLACSIGALLFLRYRSKRKQGVALATTQISSQPASYGGVAQSYDSSNRTSYPIRKLYDPSDPSTFPVTPSPTVQTRSTTNGGFSERSRPSSPSNKSSNQSQRGLISPLQTYPNVPNGREWITPVPEI